MTVVTAVGGVVNPLTLVVAVPVIVTAYDPATAVLLALNVNTLDALVGFVANAAVTPLGNPEAASDTG